MRNLRYIIITVFTFGILIMAASGVRAFTSYSHAKVTPTCSVSAGHIQKDITSFEDGDDPEEYHRDDIVFPAAFFESHIQFYSLQNDRQTACRSEHLAPSRVMRMILPLRI